ncbi:hypothetical protein ACS127_08165 [Amphibacillus sp. Q70]
MGKATAENPFLKFEKLKKLVEALPTESFHPERKSRIVLSYKVRVLYVIT